MLSQELIDKEHRRTAIVNDKLLTGCWQCRYLIKTYLEDAGTLNWCEYNKVGAEFLKITNIHVIPKECKYLVKPE